MAKETRASNSVLMGRLNYPLPKNFASKILPIENKIFSGPNALKNPAKPLALAYLPLVVARWREMHKKTICFSPKLSLKSGTERGIQGGTPWFLFLVTSLWNDKEVTSIPAQRGASAVRASVEKVVKNQPLPLR